MILATGAKGMLGPYLHEIYTKDELIATDLPELDVRDKDQVRAMIKRHRPAHVFHLAASTDVDGCEKDPDNAYRTNVLGTLNVALACQEFDVIMTYVSTVGVFGGIDKSELHTEYDTPSPVSVYGRTKLEGEHVVRDLLRRYFIVRAGWMMGGGPAKDHKFVGKLAHLIQTRDEVMAVNDKWGTPTYAKQFAFNLRIVVESGYYGLYHCVNAGMCSRYELAVEMARILGRETRVIPVTSAHFPLPAPRPRSEAACNYKLDLLGLNKMTDWREALRDYLGSWARRA